MNDANQEPAAERHREKYMKRILLIVFLLTGIGSFAGAIDLEEARSFALANSRNLAKYNLAILNASLDEKSRVYSNLPSLSLGASAGMSLWSAARAAPIENPFDTFSAGGSVSLSQRIFEGGRSIIQKAINAIAQESARKDALLEYFNILDSADNAYYAVLEAEATLEAEESAFQSALASLGVAEIRQATGMINQGDYLKVLAEKEARENTRNQARRSLSLNTTKLRAITGLQNISRLDHVEFDKYENLIERLASISDEEAEFLYGQFLRLLAVNNPSLAKIFLARERSEKNLSLAKAAYFPSLGASFSTGLNYTPVNGLEMSGGRISLSASIPVDYWILSNNVDKSKIARDSASLDYMNAEANLEAELQSALLNIFAYAGSFVSTRRNLEYTEKHFEYVMERYRLSQSSVSEYADAATLLLNSRNNHTRASYGFLQSLSKLRSLAAIDDEEKLAELLLNAN
jgi:outer membrane protein TolC